MNLPNKKTASISPAAAITYYMSLPFIYLVSILPFKLLYSFSDFLNYILFNVIGYRKKVVIENLRNSFPGKTEQEIYNIAETDSERSQFL